MNWLSLLNGFFKVASYVVKILEERKIIKADRAKRANKFLKEKNEKILKATAAKSNVKHDADSVLEDPDNRRNR